MRLVTSSNGMLLRTCVRHTIFLWLGIHALSQAGVSSVLPSNVESSALLFELVYERSHHCI